MGGNEPLGHCQAPFTQSAAVKASLHEPIVIVVHEGLVPEHPTPCPEEPAIVAEAAPAWFEPPPAWFEPPPAWFEPPPAWFEPPPVWFEPPPVWFEPPPAWFEPPLPAKLVCPPLLAPPPFMGSLLVDAHE